MKYYLIIVLISRGVWISHDTTKTFKIQMPSYEKCLTETDPLSYNLAPLMYTYDEVKVDCIVEGAK